MSQENISDLEYLFWGGGQDAKFAALKAFAAAGVDAADVLDGLPPTGGTTGQVLAKASGTDYDTGWVAQNPNLPSPTSFNFATAAMIPSFIATAHTTQGIVANSGYFTPITFPVAATPVEVEIRVTVAGAAGTKARIGIYEADANFRPTSLIVDYGEVDVDSTGAKTLTGLNTQIPAGRAVVCLVCNGTPTLRVAVGNNVQGTLIDFTNGQIFVLLTGGITYGALPTTAPTALTLSSNLGGFRCPVVFRM